MMDRLDELRIDREEATSPGARRWTARLVAAGVVALGSVVGAGWWWSSAAPMVRTATVESRSASAAPLAVLDASGYVVARRKATVSSQVTGRIVEVLVEEGMQVKRGQLLARLDSALPERQLRLAEAELAAAQSALREIEVRVAEAGLSLGRTRELLAADVAAQADLDAAKAERDSIVARLAAARRDVEVARRRVELREQELDDSYIRAPFDGVAISKDAQPGETISPFSAGGGFTRTGVCTLVDMSSLEIEVDVNEAYIHRVRAGQSARAVLDAYPDWSIPATVITTVPSADREKATVRVRLAFEEPGDPRVLPDMGVKVAFLEEEPSVGAARRPAVVVPRAALRRDGETEVVFVLRDDRVERRAVRVGADLAEGVEVLAGLSAGERVVVEGPDDLEDGDRVRGSAG